MFKFDFSTRPLGTNGPRALPRPRPPSVPRIYIIYTYLLHLPGGAFNLDCPMRRILVALLPSVLAAASVTAASDAAPAPSQRRRLLQRLVQVQVVHRHGDRTPITPMKDEAYWRSNLPEAHVLEGIARGTNLRRDGGGADCQQGQNPHAAGGRGPFGQLTSLGLLQMISLGGRLREELVHSGQGQGRGGEEHQRAAESGSSRQHAWRRPSHPCTS